MTVSSDRLKQFLSRDCCVTEEQQAMAEELLVLRAEHAATGEMLDNALEAARVLNVKVAELEDALRDRDDDVWTLEAEVEDLRHELYLVESQLPDMDGYVESEDE